MGDWTTGRGFASQDRCTGPSQAEIARAEYEASQRAKIETKQTERREFVPSPDLGWYHGFEPYTVGQRMERIHAEVARIRHEMQTVQDVFDTIPDPTSRQRRQLRRMLSRMQREIDALPEA